MSSGRDLIKELSSMRAVVGPDADEGELLRLLEKHHGNVQLAITEFYDGPQAQAPARARPWANQELVQVVAPLGTCPGQQMHVQTHLGMLRVTIPEGVTGGQTFLVRCPPVAAQPGVGYPGLQHQPVVVVHRRPPPVVYSRPYYGPCGPYPYGYRYRYGPRWGYYDSVGVGVGVLGGLLIADAMFL
eukprot:CAMPEP_0119077074 /NCGR_PEP_ID=MMETSP1178-20130426/92235_1 /TAXON_ID=33656 /ORGANISM="unid sp, Strain CCMP2000" /LENGTH=185 /DNA_ID=CAMNT_0007059409 /DNA_START=40 /DNA_END=597 /DNA_ORIENTATION=-